MRMLLKYSVLALSAASFLTAQHGGGGHGGGGHVGGGGGGFHASAPASRSFSGGYSGGGYSSGYRAVVPPASYGGHLTYSTPGMPGTYGNYSRYGQVGARPPLRPPIRRPIGYPYYGFGLYPYLGLGYYGNDGYGYDPYYDSGSGVPYQDQYAPQYQPMMDPGAGYPSPDAAYPPVPYAAYPDQQPQTQGVIPEPEAPSVPITIIMKSGQKLIVQNYAIVNGMFWDFTKPNAKRFPIASIDVAASAKATDEAGGAFPEVFFAPNPR